MVILVLLFIIAVPNLMNVYENSEDSKYKTFIEKIEIATTVYIDSNKDKIKGLENIGDIIYITLNDLVENNLLREPIINPKTDEKIPLLTKIKVIKINNNVYDIELLYP
jgi:hypothetical protein